MPHGILLLDKPRGLSSNGALQRVRRVYGAARAGHVGSLDPLATGMLPVCFDEATKVAGVILAARKAYRFTVSLGSRTATGDTEGAVVESQPVPAVGQAEVEALLAGMVGPRQQVPPMYSAVKHGGERLYRLARAGQVVERAPRAIELYRFALQAAAKCSLDLEVECSKGTYVRVLAEEVALALGTCGHVAALRRLWVEPFAGEAMHTLDSLLEAASRDALPDLLPIHRAVPDWPRLVVDAPQAQRLRHGQAARVADAAPLAAGAWALAVNGDGVEVALAVANGEGCLEPRRVFNL